MKISLICLVIALYVASVCAHTKWHELEGYTFDRYVKEFNKIYTPEEYATRKAIFEAKLQSIKAHNAHESSYKQGVNHLTDYTKEEFRALLGYKPHSGEQSKRVARVAVPYAPQKHVKIPAHVDWRDKDVVTPVKDQGRCGSCWTFATAETVESYYAGLTGKLTVLSEQQILDCTPNPNQCGGTGGCQGGTADIAIAKLVELGGLASEWTYPYVSYWGEDFQCHFNASRTIVVAQVKGITKLPSNQYLPIVNHLATEGTLAINVDAEGWHSYESGVYSGCTNATLDINHVVQLVGYGTDKHSGDYWLVRNSWTPLWGEDGYIRIAKTDTLECGTDNQPGDGTGCKGGPSKVTACGPCGLLYDASYPVLASPN